MAKPRRTKRGERAIIGDVAVSVTAPVTVPWEARLAHVAATALVDGVARLAVLACSKGLDRAPVMSIVVKRPPRRASSARSSPELQPVDRYAYLEEDFAGMLVAV